MVYIVIVNPVILSAAGVPFDQVFTSTCISAVIGTDIMILFANYPIGIAHMMGLNAYFASVVASQDISYQVVFGTVFLAGILFVVLSLTNLRETLIAAIPFSLKFGITSGIGLFVAFLGLKMSGIVVENEETIAGLGDLHDPVTLLTIAGLFITLILMVRRVKGALFLGMIIIGVIGFFTGLFDYNCIICLPSISVFFDFVVSGVC